MEFTNGVDSNKVGYALAKFIYNFDKLGAIRIFDMNVTSAKSSGSSECYFAKGYRYYNKETCGKNNNYSTILSTKALSTKLIKVFSIGKYELIECLNSDGFKQGCSEFKIDLKVGANIINSMNSRKCIISPVDYQGEYTVITNREDSKTHQKEKMKPIESYALYDKDGNLHTGIKFESLGKDKIHPEIEFNEFGTKYFDTTIYGLIGKSSQKIIKYSDFGYVMPLEIEYKDECLCIDNSYFYKLKNGKYEQIGEVSGTISLVINVYSDVELTNNMREIIEFIKKRRSEIMENSRYMAPIGVGIPNRIKITQGEK